MKITSVKATLLTDRVFWARPVERTVAIRTPNEGRISRVEARVPIPGSVLAIVTTDEGLTGIGLGGGGWPGAFLADHYLQPLLVGQDPLCIERHWERMYDVTFRYGQAGIVLMAISAVDLALWDLKGKALGQPVWQLLGGRVRERVPVYATVRDEVWAKAQGLWGVKLGGPYGPADGSEGLQKNVDYVARVREAVGPDFKIMLDCARTWTVDYTLEAARRLAPYHLAFIEEPISSQDVGGYVRLRRSIPSTLIACGEHVYTRYGARELLEKDAVDIIQPDIRWTGGLSETLKICDLATSYHIPVMPHRGAMAWTLPLLMARPECQVAEGLALTPEEATYSIFDGEPVPEGGYLTVSDAPGFGLVLRPERIERFRGDA